MAKEETTTCEAKPVEKQWHHRSVGGGIYGLGFLGSVIYFIQHAGTFWDGVFGFFKALVWPAIVAYKILEFFKL